ncbi:unnamed protein product [Urochloa decumbens]|uniref:Protein kinase domain-containing protein n=1 Tax=Urochloa decumbens TaxID=240449 RepID=A0ABC9B349_9POAL
MELKQGGDRSKWIANSNHNIQCFTEGEIERMTSNYKTILGRGAFGEVYRGVLENSSVVAVKKFVHNVKENFDQELTVHREINHKNVVRLIGYCVEENALMIVTEYIANGNLNGILHSNDRVPISLETRLRIATECAEALAFMHSYMYTQVIHGDIKPSNILLDGSLKAKISDFGISRLVNDPDRTLFTSHVMGSIGYMDPLFARDGRLTAKSDVYSFGVVMVELITRRRAATSSGEANIVVAFTNALANGVRGVREFFDAEIASQRNMKIMEGVAKLAGQCMRMERDRRPEMIDVVERLRTLGRASHQGQQRADLFSWARKSKTTSPAPVTTSSSDLCRRFSFEEMNAARRSYDKLLLVNATGYFVDSPHVILVYDFMARASLHHHLYMNQETRLTWKQRLEICIGTARGLHYLHRGTEHAIIHGSVDSTNIFIYENWVAKIIDGDNVFGEHTRRLTEKSDVHDFGALLFEILSAQVGRILLKDYMSQRALRYKEEGILHFFHDPTLKGEINQQSLNKFAETAARCVADKDIDRPSMEDVLSDLECTLQLQFEHEKLADTLPSAHCKLPVYVMNNSHRNFSRPEINSW